MKKPLLICLIALFVTAAMAQNGHDSTASKFNIETDGTGLTKGFAPVTAQKFKLIIGNQKEAPAVNELILFRAG
jgi:hypothetical protein